MGQLTGLMFIIVGLLLFFSLFFWADFCSNEGIISSTKINYSCLFLFSVPLVILGIGLLFIGIYLYKKSL